MAKGRLLMKKITADERVAQLPLEAQLLFTWMIPHLDIEGRITGNPRLLKQQVVPHFDWLDEQVDGYLNHMESLVKNSHGLIERWESEGVRVVFFPGFEDEQGPLRRDREAPSIFPPRPGEEESFQVSGYQMVQISESKETLAEASADAKLALISTCYEENIGQITPALRDKLIEIADESYPADWFVDAVQIALVNNARRLNYVTAILDRWKVDGKSSAKETTSKVPVEEWPVAPEDE